jgi:hypothetical protein
MFQIHKKEWFEFLITLQLQLSEKRKERIECKKGKGIPVTGCGGRAIAQTVSRRLPTAAARVQNQVWSCGIL